MLDVVIPEFLSNYRIYDDAIERLLGTGDVELPKIEAMTETISGSGIAGEIEAIIVGHIKAMATKISFRTLTHKSFTLLNPNGVSLTIRGTIQSTVPSTGQKIKMPLIVRIKGTSKSNDLGKLSSGKQMDTSAELAIHYIKVTLDGIEKLEIDQYNYIYKVDGVDYLLDEKVQLGEA